MQKDILAAQAIPLLKALIAIPRTSRQEAEAADFLQQYMQEKCQLKVQRSGHNLWALSPRWEEHRPTLLLNAHIDTVKPSEAWQHNPFLPTEEGDRLYGLGSNDDGASLVCLLHVFCHLCSKEQPYNLVFLASAEEEVGGKTGIESVLPLLPLIDVALVGEPTGMHPAIAEKGLMVLDVVAKGKAGHAAREEGVNAIYKALPDIEWFRTHKWEKVSPLLGPVKTTVTVLHAGTQHNVIPDQCTFLVDVRSNECYTNEELFHYIQEHLQNEVSAHSFRLNSSHISPQHPLVKRAVELGRKPFGSPTLSDQALMHFPSLKMGPGDSSRSHTADEYILLSEIPEAIDLYIQLLDGLSLDN